MWNGASDMRIVICDDDNLTIEKIKKYIRIFFERSHLKCPEIACFNKGEDVLNDGGDKDIVFLDIEMEGVDGIHVGNILKEKNSRTIIFVVTSFSEYLDDAMRFHVFRYLSKPIDKQRFYRNLDDALKLYTKITTKIPVENKQGVRIVSASDIIAVEARERKVIVHTTTEDILSIYGIQYWEEKLPKNLFFRTHRSFIINLEHVNDFDHMTIHLAKGKVDAYLTRRRYSDFKEHYYMYLESLR